MTCIHGIQYALAIISEQLLNTKLSQNTDESTGVSSQSLESQNSSTRNNTRGSSKEAQHLDGISSHGSEEAESVLTMFYIITDNDVFIDFHEENWYIITALESFRAVTSVLSRIRAKIKKAVLSIFTIC